MSECLFVAIIVQKNSSAKARYMYIHGIIMEKSHFNAIRVLSVSQMEEI